MKCRAFLAIVGLAVGIGAAGCSSSGGSDGGTTGGTTGGNTVTINGMSFSPSELVVPAGATITFKSNDTTSPHTATSEAVAGDFTNGAVDGGWTFSVDIPAGATETLTVPAGLASGTVQPYFCLVHLSAMTPANPTIKIQ